MWLVGRESCHTDHIVTTAHVLRGNRPAAGLGGQAGAARAPSDRGSRRQQAHHPVVPRPRRPTAVRVVGQDPQRAVRPDDDVAQPAQLTHQDGARLAEPRTGERHHPESLATQRHQVHSTVRDRDAARRGGVGAPDDQRVGHPGDAGAALDTRPPVVGTRGDHVELVPGVLAELAREHPAGGVPAQPLHVAVPHAPHRAALGRVPWRRRTVGREPQDLAARGRRCDRPLPGPVVPGGDVQHPVRTERDPATVVVARGRDPREDRLQVPERSGHRVELGAHHLVALRGSPVQVHQVVLRDVRRDSDAELDAMAGTLGDLQPVFAGIAAASYHNGGRIAFGPDGMLYVATGDAGATGRSQDPSSPGGKILRLTPDGAPAPGNPTEGSPVWSMGHRNVQGLGWDASGRMFASEFGQNTWDELNVITPGANYGWPGVEGSAGVAGMTDPLVVWGTDSASPSGVAVTDRAVYLVALRGERLWVVPFAGAGLGQASAVLVGELGRLRDVVVGPDGALWVLTNNTDGRGSPRAGDDRVVRLLPP